MKSILACTMLLALVPQQRCDLSHITSPDAMKAKIEEATRPYFPGAIGIASPSQHALIAVSCAHGLSYQFVSKMAQSIANDSSILNPLSEVKWLPLIGGASYNTFAISFDGGTIRYDINTRQVATGQTNDSVSALYDRLCSKGSVAPQAVADNHVPMSGPVVWLGTFQIVATNESGKSVELRMEDSLGVYYTENDFREHQQSEVEWRQDKITRNLSHRNLTVQSIQLIAVHSIPVS